MSGAVKIWVVIGVLALILVLFGTNPVKEARKERDAYRKGKDPLMLSIEEHHSKKSIGSSFSGWFGGGSGKTGGGGGMFSSQDPAPAPASPVLSGASTTNPGRQQPAPAGFAAPLPAYNPPQLPKAAPVQNNQATGDAPQPAGNGYYPPPPLTNAPAGQPVPNSFAPQSSLRHLPDGKPLGFMGEYAYTTDKEGKPIPVPDGVYPMADGRYLMAIKNGKKIAANN